MKYQDYLTKLLKEQSKEETKINELEEEISDLIWRYDPEGEDNFFDDDLDKIKKIKNPKSKIKALERLISDIKWRYDPEGEDENNFFDD